MNNYRDLYLINQIYATLFSLTNKVQIQGDKYYDNLTSRQFMAMMAVLHLSEEETTLNNIAKKLGTTKQSVKQLITIIEQKGYAVTVPSPLDKRAVNVKITELGKKVMIECGEKSIDFMADLSQGLSTEEMEILWMLLKKLYRFDGEEQDGFEEDVNYKIIEDTNEIEKRALEKFARRRHSRNG